MMRGLSVVFGVAALYFAVILGDPFGWALLGPSLVFWMVAPLIDNEEK